MEGTVPCPTRPKTGSANLKKRVNEQCRILGSLAESLEGGTGLVNCLSGLRGSVKFKLLAGGVIGGGFILSWPETRQMFLQFGV
jgi:hypothetical protein